MVPKPGSREVTVVVCLLVYNRFLVTRLQLTFHACIQVGDRKLVSVDSKWFREVQVAGAAQVDTYSYNSRPPLTDTAHVSKEININLQRGSYHWSIFAY